MSRLILLLVLASSCGFAQISPESFRVPPDTAKPHTWWHWMNGMVTREGITRDLEEMKKVGLGGAQLFHVTDGIPPGPVGYMTPEWRELVKHATQEADRLGLELCLHNCAGWSSTGGPWIDPAHSMQILTCSELRVQGPARSAGVLAVPPSRRDYYRDIAVLAFPTPEAEGARMRELRPDVTLTADDQEGGRVLDDDPTTFVRLRKPSKQRPQTMTLTFSEPFRAQAVTIVPGPGRNSHGGEIQASDDGEAFRALCRFRIPSTGITQTLLATSFEPTAARYWRIVFDSPDSKGGGISLAEVELHGAARLENWPGKAGFLRGAGGSSGPAAPASCIPAGEVRDVTGHLAADGTLDWPVPPGRWTILRIGHTTTGKENHPAPDEGRGLECDKLSREAAQIHWDHTVGKVLDDIGPLGGKVLNNVLVDSYEVGCQNWTDGFREEFSRRRGYDLLRHLPVMFGWVVDDTESSERFLWDVRTTLAELFHENYFGFFRDMAHQHGMLFSVEGYGNGNFDTLVASGMADIPMSEFWAGRRASNHGSNMASSSAHVWGRTYVGAEAFTADSDAGAWRQHPYSLKALGDHIYCGGVNRFIFHRYAQQPWLDRVPGMTMGPHGFHFDRGNTWWKQAPAWTTYLSRCQHLLQSGRHVADFCYYAGEGSPGESLYGSGLRPALPEGFAQDNCATDSLLQLFSVQDGRLVVPSGMSYRVLVLPSRSTMTPGVLRKVRDLLQAGATVIGPRPESSPSLADKGAGDEELRRLAAEVWADCDGKTVTRRQVGKGTLYWNHPMTEILADCALVPDALFDSDESVPTEWIHRRIGDADAYFVSNQGGKSRRIEGRFRVSDRVPEVWHPETGEVEEVAVYRREGSHTVVPLFLHPAGSAFVVFRKPAPSTHPMVATHNGQPVMRPLAEGVSTLTVERAIYGVLPEAGAEGVVDVTEVLRRQVRNHEFAVVASNELAGDPASGVVKKMVVEYELDGEERSATVAENQTLRLAPAGKGGRLVIRRAVYGDIPDGGYEPPKSTQTVDVTDALRAKIRQGRLVALASNDLAGDPAFKVRKQLRLDYTVNGVLHSDVFAENAMIDLPTGLPPARTPADVDIVDGAIRLTAWEPGDVEVAFSDGGKRGFTFSAPPPPVSLAGPWQVAFPPDRGAPAKISLAKLVSWPDHQDEGVRHFSGTASYEIAFDIPRDLLRPDLRAVLDLGDVQVIAEPTLNGTALGTLWTPPFRVDVSKALKPGRNVLQVNVTNLWVNRLIGDEAKPDYRDWAGARLKSWPKDALDGTRPPDTGRTTWTTWKHYKVGDPLLPSGLIGPVRIRFGRVAALPQ